MTAQVHQLILPRRANEALDAPLTEAAEIAMIAAASHKISELLEILQIDHLNDHNTRDTPDRVARMFVQELLRGRFAPPPKITEFDNVERCEQLIVTGPLAVRSLCAHHLMPIVGEAYIGIQPSAAGKIIGLSKYDRIVEHFSARFQIQEELVSQIASFIMEHTRPLGVAVRMSATHMCKTHRGVKASGASRMINTVWLGSLDADPLLRQEFLQECQSMERGVRGGF
jgi:GTP cyclohydrolase I